MLFSLTESKESIRADERKFITEAYKQAARNQISAEIANIKFGTDFDNVLPVLSFAEKMQLITTDEGLDYYDLAKKQLERVEKQRKAEMDAIKEKHKATKKP